MASFAENFELGVAGLEDLADKAVGREGHNIADTLATQTAAEGALPPGVTEEQYHQAALEVEEQRGAELLHQSIQATENQVAEEVHSGALGSLKWLKVLSVVAVVAGVVVGAIYLRGVLPRA